MMKDFMERTIASHCLQIMTFDTAAHFVPREPSYFEAKSLATKTSYFESQNMLVSDDDFVYPPIKSFLKSFKKWLALQRHDVQAVNSLYEWKQEVMQKISEICFEMEDLEAMKFNAPALSKYIDALIVQKDSEYRQLAQLRHDLDVAMDKVRAKDYYVRETA